MNVQVQRNALSHTSIGTIGHVLMPEPKLLRGHSMLCSASSGQCTCTLEPSGWATQRPCAVAVRASPDVGRCRPPSNLSVHVARVAPPGSGAPRLTPTASAPPCCRQAFDAFRDSRQSLRPPTSVPERMKSSASRLVVSSTGVRSAQPATRSSSTRIVDMAALSTSAPLSPDGNAFRSNHCRQAFVSKTRRMT